MSGTGSAGTLVVSSTTGFVFARDGQELVSRSVLRFRPRAQVQADPTGAGFTVVDVRGAPDRPGLGLVFIAARPAPDEPTAPSERGAAATRSRTTSGTWNSGRPAVRALAARPAVS